MKDTTTKMLVARIDGIYHELLKFQHDRHINLTNNYKIDDFDLVMIQGFIEEMNFIVNVLTNEEN